MRESTAYLNDTALTDAKADRACVKGRAAVLQRALVRNLHLVAILDRLARARSRRGQNLNLYVHQSVTFAASSSPTAINIPPAIVIMIAACLTLGVGSAYVSPCTRNDCFTWLSVRCAMPSLMAFCGATRGAHASAAAYLTATAHCNIVAP